MKKLLISLLVACMIFVSNANATYNSYGAIALTGGTTGCLDAINGALLSDGDVATVRALTGTYFYVLDADSAAAESSPSVISPDTSAGDKRWILAEVKPTASTTVDGTAELATEAETIAGTDAARVVTPDGLAYAIQRGTMTYAADAEASDTYVITCVPAVAAYVTGMKLSFYAKTANTGACTLNVNGLGAKAIKKLHDQDTATGDIEAGQHVMVEYDGTNFQMQSQLAGAVDVTSASNLTDNAVIRGDGGAKGIQTSTMLISDNGEMTNPSQPAFLAYVTSDQIDIAVGSAVTIVFGAEIFDQGSDFASSVFTAPATGKYQLNAGIRLGNVDSACAYYYVAILTSNGNYEALISTDKFSADLPYLPLSVSVLADMDASDTAYVVVYQANGTQQTDTKASLSSFFSGYLAN